MTQKLVLFALILFCAQQLTAQSITAKVIDSQSGEGLPYANIVIDKENSITNAEGNFTIQEKHSAGNPEITVSYLGYTTMRLSVAQLKDRKYIIKLTAGTFELETVHISNTKPNADSIMAGVRRNLAHNYKLVTDPSKNMLFYREGITFKPVQVNAEITKSTGFSKQALKTTNKELKEFTANLVSHPPQEFTEMLCNYYTETKKVNDKPVFHSKFEVIKAIKLKDKNRAVSLTEIQQLASGILFQHLDSTKYYRIKSGLFSSRDTLPLGKHANKKTTKKSRIELTSAKSDVTGFMYENTLLHTANLNFITNRDLYDYMYQGAVQSGNQYVYVLKFKPKKSKAKYTGTLYISDNDYAVIKAEYELADGKKLSGINLKFLLGIKQAENLNRGTVLFKERENGAGYYLQYAAEETGEYIYINRPLKFIEITDDDKDVAAFDLKVETNILNKREYFSMSQSAITETAFDTAKEADFKYTFLDSYDPNLWKEYSAIEPLEEMKRFKTLE
jgi:hypothetical protein